jgi:hypothetical protein
MALDGLPDTSLDMAWATAEESRLEMRASDVLNEAADILIQRENKYGEFDITAYRTASLQTLIHEEPRTAEQWCLDMVATKLARIYSSPEHLDNYLDAICYLAQAAHLVKTKNEVE